MTRQVRMTCIRCGVVNLVSGGTAGHRCMPCRIAGGETDAARLQKEVRRVLREDGTLWVNMGDSYCSQGGVHQGRDDNQSGVGAGQRAWREGSARADGDVRQVAGAIPAFESSHCSTNVSRSPSHCLHVGLCPTSVEQELDDAIQHLRTLSALAEDRGDIETAKELSRRMLAAIHSRSPEHIARLEQEAWNELQDSIDYFQAQGERDRAALLDVSARAVRRRMGMGD